MRNNDLANWPLLRSHSVASTLPHPRTRQFAPKLTRAPPAGDFDVQLLPCNRPTGLLESAPHTSLRADSVQERWEGFWSVADEHYYTRCVQVGGAEQWYRLVDEPPRDESRHWSDSRAIKFSSGSGAPCAQVTAVGMRLLAARGRRPILVGMSRRRGGRARPAPAGSAR